MPQSPTDTLRRRPPATGAALVGRYGCMAVLGLFLLTTTLCSGLIGLSMFAWTPVEFVVATVLALATAVPYGGLLLWLDRNEKEPWWLIFTALLWGAAGATFVSGIFNELFGMAAGSAVGDAAVAGQLTASLSAPFIEELTKGLAVLALFALFRKEFDNVLDGVLYGALVGLGFAWFENITYYVNGAAMGGFGEMLKLAWMRGIVSGMGGSHAAYTGLTGLGFGLVRVSRRGVLRWLAVPFFWGLAMFAHFAWNTFAGLFMMQETEAAALLVGVPLATAFLQGPFLLLLLVVVGVAWRHENRIILTHLQGESPDVITDAERRTLVPARSRTFAGIKRLFSRGPAAWWRWRRLERAWIELAFLRWHLHEDDDVSWGPDEDADVAEWRARIRQLRAAAGG